MDMGERAIRWLNSGWMARANPERGHPQPVLNLPTNLGTIGSVSFQVV